MKVINWWQIFEEQRCDILKWLEHRQPYDPVTAGIMPRSHQTFRSVLAEKLLGIMLGNRWWPTTFLTITAEDADRWWWNCPVWSAPQWARVQANGDATPPVMERVPSKVLPLSAHFSILPWEFLLPLLSWQRSPWHTKPPPGEPYPPATTWLHACLRRLCAGGSCRAQGWPPPSRLFLTPFHRAPCKLGSRELVDGTGWRCPYIGVRRVVSVEQVLSIDFRLSQTMSCHIDPFRIILR